MILRSKFREFVPIVLLFVIMNAVITAFRARAEAWNVNRDVVIAGNLLLFAITFFSFLIAKRGLQDKNPHAFVRSVYGSILVKLFLCAGAALVYIALNGKRLNKPALFVCMGLYLVYTFLEVSILTRLLRTKPDA